MFYDALVCKAGVFCSSIDSDFPLTESCGESKTIPRERSTRQDRGGEEKIRVFGERRTLDKREFWLVRSIASCQLRSYRNIHFPGLPLGVSLISWFIRILKILVLPWWSAFGSLGLYAYCLSNGAKASGYYTIVEIRFIGLIVNFSDLTMIATNGERFSFYSSGRTTGYRAPVQRLTHLRRNNPCQCLKNDIACRLTAQFPIVKLL